MDSLDKMLDNLNNDEEEMTRDEWLTEQVNSQITAIRDTEQISDGSHTFGELYNHRAVLFSVICSQFPERAWKSKLHYRGDMIEGFFIVGIDTPEGQFTYHYPLKDWGLFKVKKLDYAPEWDGHSSDSIHRLFSLINSEDDLK